MKERQELIAYLENYLANYVMGFDASHHIKLLIADLKLEEEEE